MERVMEQAVSAGYRELRLDTLATMTEARALYRQFGFVETEKYYDTPIEGTVFMRAALDSKHAQRV